MTLSKQELAAVLAFNVSQLNTLLALLSVNTMNDTTLTSINTTLARITVILTNPDNA